MPKIAVFCDVLGCVKAWGPVYMFKLWGIGSVLMPGCGFCALFWFWACTGSFLADFQAKIIIFENFGQKID